MQHIKSLNNLFGWLCFLCSFLVYMLTLQPTVSFWDCGEFIAAAFNLQVGHQPGAPLFMMISKIFTLVASTPEQIAFWVNTGSAAASAGTIMFLFWTITSLASRALGKGRGSGTQDRVIIIGAGIVGAMAYTFSDSFWFSAVEAEVYALSSLCTAVVFWAILRWDRQADLPSSQRWILFIAYLIGLSIGIHLLSLLTIPAIVLFYYYRKSHRASIKGSLLALLAGCGILAFIQFGIIQYLIRFASGFELFFVNSLGLPFGSGVIAFAVLVLGSLTAALIFSVRKRRPALNLALLSICFLLMGYGSYAMIVIRANANTSINISNPDNVFSLLGYLSRQQYGDTPLLYGPYFDSEFTGSKNSGTLYRKGTDKYEIAGLVRDESYDRNTVFPRLHSQRADHVQAYKSWLAMGENEKADFADNIRFFTSYQLGFMYMRYFFWNFVGRQNDIPGHGEVTQGNWISGIKPIDSLRLGEQRYLPDSVVKNKGYNRFFGLPLLVGLAGLFFYLKRRPKDAAVTATLFFFTGIAITLYLNQGPYEPRERDYAYVGSFYAFAIWIGMGVLAIAAFLKRFSHGNLSVGLSVAACLTAAPVIMAIEGWDDHNRSDNYVAHDMAVNYLESCAPNAILFTNADNDTYPLWYVQEVEGVRPDVRIVNLQLLYDPSYVEQLTKKVRASAPLPLTMAREKYVQGTRDVLPYFDYGISDSVELKDIFEVLISEDKSDKIEMQDGSWLNFLPTRKFQLTVDKEQLLKTGTVKAEDLARVTDKMEWQFSGNIFTRADLALLDILAHNDWERPVYFTVSLPNDSYFGLDRYLNLEGYAYRLLPFSRKENDKRDKSEVSNTPVLYANMMSKFKLDSFKKASYLDADSRRISRNTWATMNTLAGNLLSEGDHEKAKKVMNKTLEVLPSDISDLIDTVDRYQSAALLYRLNETEKANLLASSSIEYLNKELTYYVNLDTAGQRRSYSMIQTILAIMEDFRKEAVLNKQDAIDRSIRKIYDSIESKLT